MDKWTKVSEQTIIKYFDYLTTFGYKKYSQVYEILVLLFIEEMLCTELAYFVSENDYREINNALYCLAEDCSIGFPEADTYDSFVRNIYNYSIRTTEDGIIRESQDMKLRVSNFKGYPYPSLLTITPAYLKFNIGEIEAKDVHIYGLNRDSKLSIKKKEK